MDEKFKLWMQEALDAPLKKHFEDRVYHVFLKWIETGKIQKTIFDLEAQIENYEKHRVHCREFLEQLYGKEEP